MAAKPPHNSPCRLDTPLSLVADAIDAISAA
jgi:hypothetical protein